VTFQLNKNLEEQGKNIFKEWFFKCNFPNNNGKMVNSGLGKISKNLIVDFLKNHADF
jgi:hypothetical protein